MTSSDIRKPKPDDPEWLFLSEEERHAILDPDNAGNPIAVREKAKRATDTVKERLAVAGALLETRPGRNFLAWLLIEQGGIFRTSEPGDHDTNAMHFREGAKTLALLINNLALKADPKQYIAFLEENSHKI